MSARACSSSGSAISPSIPIRARATGCSIERSRFATRGPRSRKRPSRNKGSPAGIRLGCPRLVQGLETFLALQPRLAAARAADARGDHAAALAEVEAALALDPDFLAAQTLRD